MYATRQKFITSDGVKVFGGHIFARSVAEAEQLCRSFGAQLDGEIIGGHTEVFNEGNDDILDAQEFNL
jgi:hypothetical protein